jgi:hypothetical protein
MANLSASGLSKFRRWYTQYKAIHGMEPPQNLMDSYLAGEMEAESAREASSRQISLQEKSLTQSAEQFGQNLSLREREAATGAQQFTQNLAQREKEATANTEYQNKTLAQREAEVTANLSQREKELKASIEQNNMNLSQRDKEFLLNYELNKDSVKNAEQAAMVSGVKDIASLGIEGYKAFGSTRGLTTGLTASKASPFVESQSGLNVLGSEVNAYDAGGISLSEAGSSGIGATRWGSAAKGLGTLAAAAAIEYTKPAVVDYLSDQNIEAGKAADVSASIGEGALLGSSFGGIGAAVGAVLGAEKGGFELSSGGEPAFYSEAYNKDAGIAALFGITAGQIESPKDSSSIQTAKAVLTGGFSKIARKLKKWF